MEDRRQSVEEYALAVAARAVEEEQCVLSDAAGERVAGSTLQERLERGIFSGDLPEESVPQRTIAARRDSGNLRHVALRIVRQGVAGLQVDDPARRVQQPGISVPLINCCGVPAIGTSELFDCCRLCGARDLELAVGL